MAGVNKVGHVVLNVRDVDASKKFYSEGLGMEIMAHNQERHMAFLSFGTQHHDMALFKAPEGAERSELGLNHIAMQQKALRIGALWLCSIKGQWIRRRRPLERRLLGS